MPDLHLYILRLYTPGYTSLQRLAWVSLPPGCVPHPTPNTCSSALLPASAPDHATSRTVVNYFIVSRSLY